MKNVLKNLRDIMLLVMIAYSFGVYGADDTLRQKEGYRFRTVLYGKSLLLRDSPSASSPITDTIIADGQTKYSLRFLDELDGGWCMIRRGVPVLFYVDGKPDHYGKEYFTRYVDKKSLLENTYKNYTKKDSLVPIVYVYSGKDKKSPVLDSTYHKYSSLDVVGSPDGEWVKVLADTKESRDAKLKNSDQYRIFGYVEGEPFRQSFEQNVYYSNSRTDSGGSGKTGLTPQWAEFQQEWHHRLGAPLNAQKSFPIAVLIMMVLIVIAPVITRGYDKRTMYIHYFLMMAVILMELSYILLFGYELRFCRILGGGFIDGLVGIFFTLLTLGVIYVQYIYFFSLIRWIKTFSRNFSTWIGTTLPGVIVILILVYAIFSSLSTKENLTLIYTLLGIEVLQIVVIMTQMRKYPAYGVMAALLIPLGTVAIIMTALMTFQFAAVLAIFFIVFKGMVSGVAASGGASSSDTDGAGYVGVAKNCPHFRESGFYCNFRSCSCSMCHTGKCDYGQM